MLKETLKETLYTSFSLVDDLRKNSLHFTNNNGFTVKGRPANRVEFLPIQWYSSVRDDKFGIDKYVTSFQFNFCRSIL